MTINKGKLIKCKKEERGPVDKKSVVLHDNALLLNNT